MKFRADTGSFFMQAYLILEDGEVFTGEFIGFEKETDGEVVFSTGMTGYVESLTDPSFAGQILTFTYPLIGNYGVPKFKRLDKDLWLNRESRRIWVQGVVVSEMSVTPSHYEHWKSLDQWLKREKIPALVGIDTRALTLKLREKGVMKGRISLKKRFVTSLQTESNAVALVSCTENITYKPVNPNGTQVVLIDCGVKHGIIRQLLNSGFKVTRVPYYVNPICLKEKVDAVICSNGPGDPKKCQIVIQSIREILKEKIPFLGICLGHQLLALAIGADTYKMKYGHRGLNQPCQDTRTSSAYLTSQNHGYAVSRKSIPEGFREWFINLNDGTNEGIISEKKSIWSTQFHPEGNPGPFDTNWVFDLLNKV